MFSYGYTLGLDRYGALLLQAEPMRLPSEKPIHAGVVATVYSSVVEMVSSMESQVRSARKERLQYTLRAPYFPFATFFFHFSRIADIRGPGLTN